MVIRNLILICIFSLVFSCSSKDQVYVASEKVDPYKLYQEGFKEFERNNFFLANKKFSQAELNFDKIELASKSAIMSIFSLYGINFYNQALDELIRFKKTYPADKNIIYAHYLEAIIYYEQISDEKKDLDPLLKANKKIDFFLTQYPNSDYAIDLKFKKDLIKNQLAAKELFVAKYYISTQKWVPAINRLKLIVKDYDETVFIEEALHRLIEIHFHLGLQDEAERYASILGYNYNSSEWYQQSFKILNKDYEIQTNLRKKNSQKKEKNFFKKIIEKIK